MTTKTRVSAASSSDQFSQIVAADSSSSTLIQGPALPPLEANAKRLFLVRHGEVINPGGDRPVYYGAQDVPLSPLGKLEATVAGVYLRQFPLSHVFCSPLQRAVYGAQQVLEQQQQQQQQQQPSKSKATAAIIVVDGLKELDRGDWYGKTKDEIGADLLARFDACDESVTPGGGGESYPALKRRVLDALRMDVLQQMEPGNTAAIVSHLQVTRCILSWALNIPTEQMVDSIKIATASVTCVDFDAESSEPKVVHFQSFKPESGLQKSQDGPN